MAVVEGDHHRLFGQRPALDVGHQVRRRDGRVPLRFQVQKVLPEPVRGHHVQARPLGVLQHAVVHEDGQRHPLLGGRRMNGHTARRDEQAQQHA